MSIETHRKAAFTRLLDDPAPIVRRALLEEFKRLKTSGIAFLKAIESGDDKHLRAFAKAFIKELNDDDPIITFQNFIRSYHYELETGSLMLSQTLYPDFDIAKNCLFLDEMADRCRELLMHPSSPQDECRVLNRVFFHEYGFVGDVETFHNPENTFLHTVIERRRGIPISLSILYLLVAYRCGIELEPIGLPGRFMVGCFLEREPFFIDVYDRGVFRSVEDVQAILERNDIEFDPVYLTPTPVGDVLLRCCRNLVNQFTEIKDPAKAELFSGFINEFEDAYDRHT